jgi:hypothetical protein
MKMKIIKFAFVAGLAVVSTLSVSPARADLANQASKLTFNQPIEVPGMVLPSGTYLFQRDRDDLNVVRIFNADGTHLYTTIQTISAVRLEPTGDTVVTLAERPAGTPVALVKWFYPGNDIGHEFVFPKHEEQQLAQARQMTIDAKQVAASGD